MSDRRQIGAVGLVLTGKAKPYTRPGSMSGIDKRGVEGKVAVGKLGLAGDEQGDLRHHGGVHKAVHLYAFEHYPLWREEIGDLPVLRQPGAFGENLSTLGVDESNVCLGDQLRIGSALLEVSQGRQPCWKLNDRFGVPNMARRLQDSARTGWYCRVLEEGELASGDAILLEARPHPEWPLARLIEVFYHRCLDRELLREASRLPLVESWQQLIARRLATSEVEDWSLRMEGRAP
ncbi:MOSC domain-containing protein [Xenophilus sp. AP218F]|nr:MOSC domain-containing protein [Chromobacterium sp. ASV5]OWY39834.1 MOSC domain-containing protein [Xenophilus sp. AP218F]